MFVKTIITLKAITSVCVCGAGTMGSGITQAAAQAGFKTILFDVNSTILEKSRSSIINNLELLVSKEKLTTEEKNNIINRINFTSDLNDCKADIIIEAIIENEEAKVELFKQLSTINSSETIFATNTSSISVSSIAAHLPHPKQVAGMHFFNPAPVMKLVEVVRGKQTSEAVVQSVYTLAKQFGKTPVICEDVPGFVVNRVARPYYLEALNLLEQGLADVETIDEVMQASGFKMGPFKLMDLIGIDVNFSVSNIVWEALGKPERLTPSSLQKQKTEAGKLGRKTGKGFYNYPNQNGN